MKLASHIAAALFLSWLGAAHAQSCNQPGPLALAYANEASTHPWDDGFGKTKREHIYRFTLPQAKKLCSIGYEAPSPAPGNYNFRLYNCNSGSPVQVPGANVNIPGSAFSPGLQYQTITPAWPLLAGTCYEIHRRVTGPASLLSRAGRRLANENLYPIASPWITILGTNFFTPSSGPFSPDNALPFIDFGIR